MAESICDLKPKFPNAERNAEVCRKNAEFYRERAKKYEKTDIVAFLALRREVDIWNERAKDWDDLAKEFEKCPKGD